MDAIKNITSFNERGELKNIIDSEPYRLRVKLNNGGKLTRKEKDYITKQCNGNTFFKSAIPLLGMKISFADVLKRYLVYQYGWTEYKAIDKTALRRSIYGNIKEIVQI